METLITGLHHVTTIAGDAQRNVDFYTEILGLRLVKKTINFDAPDVYHLYYGDETGSPGTIMTFFPYGRLPHGRKGTGQLTYTAFTIPTASLSFWVNRLAEFHIAVAGPYRRFNETYIRFEDFDGMGVELVTDDTDFRKGWATPAITAENAIRGFHTVTLNEAKVDKTIELLTGAMNHILVAEESGRFRFKATAGGGAGTYVDVQHSPNELQGAQGAGTVHHVAFATDTDESQIAIQEKLSEAGFQPTQVLDRNYFHSIYFREPGGILFEVATNPPGFAVDEPVESLGTTLKLPEWYEPRRAKIEAALPPIQVK